VSAQIESTTGPSVAATPPQPARFTSVELFRGRRHIVIVHGGQEYRLQITKTGKLILTK
jgi:hemin uptake protein HemP